MSLRCQARIVSGVTIVATAASAFFLNRFPISARVLRSPSLSRSRPWICFRKIRFSATKYSLRRKSSSSTEPVIYASKIFQSIRLTTSVCSPQMDVEYQRFWERNISQGASFVQMVTYSFQDGFEFFDQTGKVLMLDRSLENTLPYLFALLGLDDPTASLQQMDPQIRRQRTFDAIKKLFLRESLNQPLILIFEDLHWIDTETQGFLDTLSEGVASARILLLV